MKGKRPDYQNNRIAYFFETFIPLMLLWIIMSGIFEFKFICFGAISCAIIAAASIKVLILGGLKSDRQYFTFHVNAFKMAGYLSWLVKEIIKSSIYVSKVVLFDRAALNPHIIWFKADYDHPAARALLANSITLTPGTITIDIYDDGVYSVHALTDETAEGLLEGTMQKKIAALYGEEIDYRIVEVREDKSLRDRKPARVLSKVFIGGRKLRKLERR